MDPKGYTDYPFARAEGQSESGDDGDNGLVDSKLLLVHAVRETCIDGTQDCRYESRTDIDGICRDGIKKM
jgi:hypothetical protein